jgi:hypothetical protein
MVPLFVMAGFGWKAPISLAHILQRGSLSETATKRYLLEFPAQTGDEILREGEMG